MDKMQTYHAFWNSFKIKAYDQYTTPDDATFPYITYEAASDDFGNILYLSASLWYRSESWVDITLKAQEIANYISRGGKMIPYNGGAMWIRTRSPWAQRMNDPSDDMIRRMILNFTVEFEE